MAYDTLLVEDFDALNINSEFAGASSASSNSFTLRSNGPDASHTQRASIAQMELACFELQG